MSEMSAILTTHSLEVGDTVNFLHKELGNIIQSCLHITEVYLEEGTVGGYTSFVTLEDDGSVEASPPEWAEWMPEDHDYVDGRVYMVITKDLEVVSAPSGGSLYCGIKVDD